MAGKVFKGFRFKPELYANFSRLVVKEHYTLTDAFEGFMMVCVERGGLFFPEVNAEGLEAEARVLVDWLRKGKRFYRNQDGEEVNVSGTLIRLLSRVRDASLRLEIEEILKASVSEQ